MATKQSENGQKKKAPAFSAKIDALCDTGSSTKAFASVCISGRFVVRDIAVMEGKNGLFARMPCRSYQDRHGNTHYWSLSSANRRSVTSSPCSRSSRSCWLPRRKKEKISFSSSWSFCRMTTKPNGLPGPL